MWQHTGGKEGEKREDGNTESEKREEERGKSSGMKERKRETERKKREKEGTAMAIDEVLIDDQLGISFFPILHPHDIIHGVWPASPTTKQISPTAFSTITSAPLKYQ